LPFAIKTAGRLNYSFDGSSAFLDASTCWPFPKTE